MCTSATFNSTIDPKIMNFEPPIKSNHLFSTSPPYSSLTQTNPLTIDQSLNTLNSNFSNNNLLAFNPNSRSPTYGLQDDEMKMEYKKKAKSCLVCGESAFYFFYGSLCCDACRTFFRRSSLQNNAKNLKCPFNGKCVINSRTRKDCSKCRLEKCLSVGMRADLIVNAKEERRRKSQSINLYDFQFNNLSPNASNLYNASSNNFNSLNSSNFGFSAIQSEYEQYLQSCYAYYNAYHIHNSLNNFNPSLLNSLKPSNYTQSSAPRTTATNSDLETLTSLNSLNQLKYHSSINPFLFNNDNSLETAATYLDKHHLINNVSSSNFNALNSNSSIDLDSNLDLNGKRTSICRAALTGSSLEKNLNELSTNFLSVPSTSHLSSSLLKSQQSISNYRLKSPNLVDQISNKDTKTNFNFLNSFNEPDSEEVTNRVRKLSFLASNDENAKDGFDRLLNENDFDKLDLNKLNLSRTNPSFSSSSSSCSSLSSSYTCSNVNTSNQQPNSPLDTETEAKSINNAYNWKKRKIQYLTDEEIIEKENRKVFRTLAKQNQSIKNQRLEEILKVSKRVMKTPDYKLNDCKLNDENSISRSHLYLLEALKWQFFGITKLCSAFREITAYKQLNEIEKKQLLMANCTYILMLSSTKYYNFKNQAWDINVKLINQLDNQENNQENNKIKMSVPISVMNTGSKKDLASFYIKFMELFDRKWLDDEILMTLTFVICLFYPDEKLIKKINNIQYEHEYYLGLLEDYLEKKFKSQEISKKELQETVKQQFNLIKKFLEKLTDFKEIFETAHVVLAKEETLHLYRHLTEQLSV